MAVAMVAPGKGGLKGKVSDAEWRTRVDLAAFYRLVAHYRMTDRTETHISAAVPDEWMRPFSTRCGWKKGFPGTASM